MEYSSTSKTLTAKLTKADKKAQGIYFTPPSCIANIMSLIKDKLCDNPSILEPSCGSGEFITAMVNELPDSSILGIEHNQSIHEAVKSLERKNIDIIHHDFLLWKSQKLFDLIIGNPPYFVLKKASVDKKYHEYFDGRPNIFILFIVKSLELLNTDGVLAFVLPKSFLNCLYYNKTRKYIFENLQILFIEECKTDKYLETQQETIILILKKQVIIQNTQFIFKVGEYVIFSNPDVISNLTELCCNSQTLSSLDFKVSVGTVVWNQCKNILSSDKEKTRLIYSSDIVDGNLEQKKYKNAEKKNFIDRPGIADPIIVINRGYGKGAYNFNYCLIDTDKEFLIENHLIVITNKNKLPRSELIESYKKILNSLNDKRTSKFVELYFGNSAINTSELAFILPIYYDI